MKIYDHALKTYVKEKLNIKAEIIETLKGNVISQVNIEVQLIVFVILDTHYQEKFPSFYAVSNYDFYLMITHLADFFLLRSSRPEVFCKKGVPGNSQNS